MLNVLRDSFQNQPYLKWVLLLVAASLTLYLGSYFACDQSGGARRSMPWAIRVNGETISVFRYEARARERARWFENLLGPDYDRDRLRSQVVFELVNETLAAQEARRSGLLATPAEISRLIFGNPLFTDPQGNFVQRREYERRVQDVYYVDTGTYEDWLADSVLAVKWLQAVTEPVMVTDDELLALFRERTERTAVRYVVVAAADQEADLDVAEADIEAYYALHQEEFAQPEGRRIRYVSAERDAMRSRASVTEEEIAAFYQASIAEYTHPEQRRARQMVFSVTDDDREAVRAVAEKAHERLRAGAAWDTVLTDVSAAGNVRGADLGWFGRSDPMVPQLQQAAFETPVGQLTPVVESDVGFHVAEVLEEREAGTVPLDGVRDEIRAILLNRRAAEMARATAERARQAAEQEGGLDAAAAAEGLTVREATLRRGQPAPQIGPSQEFNDAVWSLPVGSAGGPLAVARGFATVVVEEELPAGIAPLDEVRERVRGAVMNDRLRQAAVAEATRAFDSGKTLDGAAARLGIDAEESGDLLPGQVIARTGGYTPEATAALFGPETEVGSTGVVPVPAGAMIYEVTRRDPFDPEAFSTSKDSLRAELSNVRRRALELAVVNRLREEAQIEMNEAVIYADRSG